MRACVFSIMKNRKFSGQQWLLIRGQQLDNYKRLLDLVPQGAAINYFPRISFDVLFELFNIICESDSQRLTAAVPIVSTILPVVRGLVTD